MTKTKTHGNDQTLFHVGTNIIFWRQNAARSKNNETEAQAKALDSGLASCVFFRIQASSWRCLSYEAQYLNNGGRKK